MSLSLQSRSTRTHAWRASDWLPARPSTPGVLCESKQLTRVPGSIKCKRGTRQQGSLFGDGWGPAKDAQHHVRWRDKGKNAPGDWPELCRLTARLPQAPAQRNMPFLPWKNNDAFLGSFKLLHS
jgi:hypothetical protein